MVMQIAGVYLFLGIVALVLLDLKTKRVRGRWKTSSWETQHKLAESGSFVGSKTAKVIFLIVLWVFWPAAIYGAVSTLGKHGDDSER